MRYTDYGDNPEVPAPTELQEKVGELLEGANMPQDLVDKITEIIDRWEQQENREPEPERPKDPVVCYGMTVDKYQHYSPEIELRQTSMGLLWFAFESGKQLSFVSFHTTDEAQKWAWENHKIGIFNYFTNNTP